MSPQQTSSHTDQETLLDEPELAEPKLYDVVLLNDDYTTMDFVIDVMMQFFRKPYSDAERLMFEIHECGSAVCATYCLEIAEIRVKQVIDHARAHDFPLLCVMQPH